MNNVTRYFVILTLVFLNSFFVCAFADALPEQFKVLPAPKEIHISNNSGLEFGEIKSVKLVNRAELPVFDCVLAGLIETESNSKGVLTLEILNNIDSRVQPKFEGYRLIIINGSAEILSHSQAGLFYGVKTLEQLLEDARDNDITIPSCRITDYPTLTYRAVHFDVKNHLDSVKYYYDAVDRLAKYKINAIIFEFEDKLGYRRQPLVGAEHAISIEEMAALTNYARDRHIEISPLVQGLGHATYILKHEKYAHLRENTEDYPHCPRTWAFCPLHEGTYQVLFDLYRDAMDATPGSKYLHIGGDEIRRIGQCPRCKPTAEKDGVFGLNLYWLNRVSDFLQEHGRTPIFWDDMPLKHAGVYGTTWPPDGVDKEETDKAWEQGRVKLNEMLDRFPKNCFYMRWNYTDARQLGNIYALDWYRDSGLNVMIATSAQGISPLLPMAARTEHGRGYEDGDRVKFTHSFITMAAERGIKHNLCCAWDDASPHMETYWRGLISSAEFGWNPTGRDLAGYEIAYLQRMFGPDCIEPTDLYSEMFRTAEFWRVALFEVGDAVQKPTKMLDLPDPNDPGTWSEKHKDHLGKAKIELTRYEKTSSQLGMLAKRSRRNQYHVKLLQAINNFQINTPRLLVALENFDKSQKPEDKKIISKVLEEFDAAWAEMLKVYSKTRFLAYPKNYVKDRTDVHFASQREDQSWLIIYEEKYRTKVKDWLKETEEQ